MLLDSESKVKILDADLKKFKNDYNNLFGILLSYDNNINLNDIDNDKNSIELSNSNNNINLNNKIRTKSPYNNKSNKSSTNSLRGSHDDTKDNRDNKDNKDNRDNRASNTNLTNHSVPSTKPFPINISEKIEKKILKLLQDSEETLKQLELTKNENTRLIKKEELLSGQIESLKEVDYEKNDKLNSQQNIIKDIKLVISSYLSSCKVYVDKL